MKRILTTLALILGLCPSAALADFNATAGSGLVIFGFTCFSTKVCTAWVPINSAGTELFTGANPGIATGSGTAGSAATGVLTVQGIASMTPLIVTNSGTFAVQAAQAGTWNITNISGTVSLPTGAATAANQAAMNTWAGGTLGAMANYGTSPGAVLVPSVNAFVTNAPANGAHNTANSTTQNLATDQAAIAAWGQVATGAAPPTGAQYLGANASGATGGLVRGVINCDLHVFKHITTATDTLAVQGVASQTIYVCGALGQAAGTATWFLENTASANANCSSANTQITGVATMVANGSAGFYNPVWGGLKNTAGNGLCINSTGTGGVDLDVWYAQF